MKFKETLTLLKNLLIRILRIVIIIGSTIIIFIVFRQLGLKGLLGFLIGAVVVSVILLSKNPMALFVIKAMRGEFNILTYLRDDGDEEHEEDESKDWIQAGHK